MDNGPWSMLQRLTLRQVALLCHHCAQLLETKMGRLRWGDEDGRPKSGLCLKSLSQIFVSGLCLWRCGGMRRGRCGGDRRFLGGASSTAWRLAWEGADHCAQLRGDFWRPSTSARPPQVPPQFWTMDNGPWSMLQRLTLRQVALLCHHCAQLLETKMGRLRWGDEDGRPKSGLCLKSLSLVFVSGGAEGCGGDDAEGTGDFWGGHRQRLGVSPGKVRTIARNCGVTSGDRALVLVRHKFPRNSGLWTMDHGPCSSASRCVR